MYHKKYTATPVKFGSARRHMKQIWFFRILILHQKLSLMFRTRKQTEHENIDMYLLWNTLKTPFSSCKQSCPIFRSFRQIEWVSYAWYPQEYSSTFQTFQPTANPIDFPKFSVSSLCGTGHTAWFKAIWSIIFVVLIYPPTSMSFSPEYRPQPLKRGWIRGWIIFQWHWSSFGQILL